MKSNKLFGFLALLLLSVVALTSVSAIPVAIDSVEVNDVQVFTGGTNKLDQENNDEISVRVKLTASQDVSNVELAAFMSGYEYNQFDRIASSTRVFDMNANVSYVKTLKLKLSDLVERDSYKLRILVSDRNGDQLIQNYALNVNLPRHSLKIEDVVLYPTGEVKAGNALLSTVRVENRGQKDEKDVKITFKVPSLGLSASDYIEEIESGDEKETEELYLKLPKCAAAGEYEYVVDVSYDKGHESLSARGKLNVAENEACKATAAAANTTAPAQTQPEAKAAKSTIRSALEIMLLILVGLLVLVGLIIGFSKLRGDEE